MLNYLRGRSVLRAVILLWLVFLGGISVPARAAGQENNPTSLVPRRDELLFEGTVRSVMRRDSQFMLLVGQVTDSKGAVTPINPNRTRLILVTAGVTLLCKNGNAGMPLASLLDLSVGATVQVTGRNDGEGRTVPARVVSLVEGNSSTGTTETRQQRTTIAPASVTIPVPRQEISKKPFLRLETAMHTTAIKGVDVDANDRFIVTASEDKTVRVWEPATRRQVIVLRPPIGDAWAGQMHAVAITPDAKTVACGGETGGFIYLFDRETATITRTLYVGRSVEISCLAYSRDGKYLAAGTDGEKEGEKGLLRVFDAISGVCVLHDTFSGRIGSLNFDDAGRLLASSFFNTLKLYDADFRLLKQESPGPKRGGKIRYPEFIIWARLSPDGEKIAITYFQGGVVDVLSGRDLSFQYTVDTGVPSNPSIKLGYETLAWSRDSRYLYGGGTAGYPGEAQRRVRKWSDGGRGPYTDFNAIAINWLTEIKALRSGGIAFSTLEPSVGILDCPTISGGQAFLKRGAVADFREGEKQFRISDDGATVAFPFTLAGGSPARVTVQDQTLTRNVGNEGLRQALTDTPDMVLVDHGPGFRINGNSAPIAEPAWVRVHAITRDHRSIFIATHYNLYLFDAEGNKKWEQPQANGPPILANVSGDGRIGVIAYMDGTIHWYRLSDGVELLGLFPHENQRSIVFFTPSGYYSASAGAESLIGWHVNNGSDNAGDFFTVDRFRETFYRPDIISRVLETRDELEAIRLADAQIGKNTPNVPVMVAQKLPPVVTLLSPTVGATFSRETVTVRVSVRTPMDTPVTRLQALVDGRPTGTRGLDFIAGKKEPNGTVGDGTLVQEWTIPVPAQDCVVSVLAENKNATSSPASVRLRWTGVVAVTPSQTAPENPDAFVIKSKLYVLAVGVGKYAQPGHDLDFPGKDAMDFVAAMKRQEGGLYREVVVKVMTDGEASRDAVVDGLEWIQRQTTQKDVAMVFLSGHGANDPGGNYHFLPNNFDGEHWKRTAVSFTDIRSSLSEIAGKVLFFVDTCHSGNVLGTAKRKGEAVDIIRIVNELASAENGVVVFAASTGRQLALEDMAWNNGAFTKAVLEGVGGAADFQQSGRITVNMLDLYISERVKELTRGAQTPTTSKPATIADFPIAIQNKK